MDIIYHYRLFRVLFLLPAFLVFLFSVCLGQPKPDSLKVDHIYLEKAPRPVKKSGHSAKSSRDVFRHMTLLRIPLSEQGNWPLWNATHPDRDLPMDEGIVMHLVEALRKGEIKGRHPGDLLKRYDFFDLVYDLIEWQELESEALEGHISRDKLDWFGLNEAVDLIVDEGFSGQNSRTFFRIRFVRLIWHDPMSSKGAHVAVIFPYQEIRPLLSKLECKLAPDQARPVAARELLEMRRFQARSMPIADDPTQVLPPPNRPRPKPPVWWKQ